MAKIITDSSCDLSVEEAKNLGVEMICMTVVFDDRHYIDKIELDNNEFYDKLETCESIPSTTLLNPADYIEMFDKYPDEDIIVITIGSKLSGTFQSANIAKDMTERDNIYVVDSKNATAGQGLLVKQAAKWNKEGKNAKEIVEGLEYMASNVKIVAIMDTLKYVVKGGRLSAVEGAVGTVLNLKPVICLEDGEIKILSKSRGTKAALRELTKTINTDLCVDDNYEMCYIHSKNEDMLTNFRDQMNYDGNSYMLGSIVGTHIGPGAIGMAYIGRK